MAKAKVFISHITRETELAQALKGWLVSDFLGLLDIFVSSDKTTIRAGAPWLKELGEALADSAIAIILCSEESVGRPWVNFEAGACWIRGIPIIPVCHSGMTSESLPVPLSTLQAVEAGSPEDLQKIYAAVAGVLGVQVPKTDFHALAREVKELEKKYKQINRGIELIENPSILCAASEQYARDTNFDLDVRVLEGFFPQRVVVERGLTKKRLRDLLMNQDFPIIHLALPVDPVSGDLIFSPVDPMHQPTTSRPDRMSPESFSDLLIDANARLVVMATCYALDLAIEVARVANMVATKIEVSGEQIEEWGRDFYDLIAQGHSVYKAYERTESDSSLPMKLVRNKDVAFSFKAP